MWIILKTKLWILKNGSYQKHSGCAAEYSESLFASYCFSSIRSFISRSLIISTVVIYLNGLWFFRCCRDIYFRCFQVLSFLTASCASLPCQFVHPGLLFGNPVAYRGDWKPENQDIVRCKQWRLRMHAQIFQKWLASGVSRFYYLPHILFWAQ